MKPVVRTLVAILFFQFITPSYANFQTPDVEIKNLVERAEKIADSPMDPDRKIAELERIEKEISEWKSIKSGGGSANGHESEGTPMAAKDPVPSQGILVSQPRGALGILGFLSEYVWIAIVGAVLAGLSIFITPHWRSNFGDGRPDAGTLVGNVRNQNDSGIGASLSETIGRTVPTPVPVAVPRPPRPASSGSVPKYRGETVVDGEVPSEFV